MAQASLDYRIILAARDDVGETPSKDMDETTTLGLAKGLRSFTPGQRLRLSQSASDQALTFTNACALFIFSHDNTFKVRLAGGETLLGPMLFFAVAAESETDSVVSTSVLLSGNGSADAELEVWIAEKVT